jgi:hypothetical protein
VHSWIMQIIELRGWNEKIRNDEKLFYCLYGSSGDCWYINWVEHQ